jgi:hypothetical protein
LKITKILVARTVEIRVASEKGKGLENFDVGSVTENRIQIHETVYIKTYKMFQDLALFPSSDV